MYGVSYTQHAAIVDARAHHGRLIRIPRANYWAVPRILTHGLDGAKRYHPHTIHSLVNQGFAVFTKFGERPLTHPGELVPTEIELLDIPVIDPETERPTIPAGILKAALMWREARRLTRDVATLLRAFYPTHSTVPFMYSGQIVTGRVIRHEPPLHLHIQMASGRIELVTQRAILRAILGRDLEAEPALDSSPPPVL